MHQPVLDQQSRRLAPKTLQELLHFAAICIMQNRARLQRYSSCQGETIRKRFKREDNKLNTSIPQRSSMRVSDFLPLARGSTTITLLLVEPLIVRSPLPEPGEISAPCSLLHQSVNPQLRFEKLYIQLLLAVLGGAAATF
jgi:hypothetical protein